MVQAFSKFENRMKTAIFQAFSPCRKQV